MVKTSTDLGLHIKTIIDDEKNKNKTVDVDNNMYFKHVVLFIKNFQN